MRLNRFGNGEDNNEPFILGKKGGEKHAEWKRAAGNTRRLMISEKMANAIAGWMQAFYQQPAWLEHGVRVSNMPITITEYMATLACNEIVMDAGPSARGRWITEQIGAFLSADK